MFPRCSVLCGAAMALVCVATNAQEAPEAPGAFVSFRLLGGGSSSSPSPSPRPQVPTFFTYQAPTTPAACTAAISASEAYLEVGNADKETNWDDAALGHAQYMCLEPMIRVRLQYEKAISYAWCVYPHCEENCPGADCPIHDTIAKCQSAVKNWLGYAERKKVNGNLSEAQQYYEEAIDAWPENCGALGYRAELELQKGNTLEAKSKLSTLCADPACSGHDAVREAATVFWRHASLGRENVPAACDWALGLTSAAAPRAAFRWLISFVGIAMSAVTQSART